MRRRARLRTKETKELRERIEGALGGAKLWADEAAVETGEFNDRSLIVVDNKLFGLWAAADMAATPFLTVRGLLHYRPASRFVTVDMGAVKFVVNGADVMAPGIVEADPGIQPGDLVWIRDERNKVPLAVGEALVPGAQMPRGPKGKAVKSLHHVGDPLWELEI